jgi:hypothetical protein
MRLQSGAFSAYGLSLALAAFAAADEGEWPDETQRWVPSFSVSFDAFTQHGNGSVRSSEVLGPPLSGVAPDGAGDLGCLQSGSSPPNRYGDTRRQDGSPGSDGRQDLCIQGSRNSGKPLAPYQLMPDNSDEDANVLPMVVGSFEVMTPRLVEGLAQPRLFAHVDLALAFGTDRRLAGVRAPEAFAAPKPIINFPDIQEDTVVGQGSRANLKTGDLVVSAGAGVAFAAKALGRNLRVKPSLEYIRQPVEIQGTLHRAVKLEDIAQPGTLDQFRLISLGAQDSLILNGFGGGLELEADTSRVGPLMLSVFCQGRGYYFPKSLNETRAVSNSFGETTTWTFQLDPWAWRGAVGLRFRWLPEE